MSTQMTKFHNQPTLKQAASNLLEWIKHQLVEGSEIDLINLLRWEDDGGKIYQAVEATSWSASAPDYLIRRREE